MTLLLACIFGFCIGSFLNVVIDRIPRGEGIVVGHSHCDFCGHTLLWYDLIPLFSFLQLQGKCRYCHKFIGWKYPFIELTTAISFASVLFLSLPLTSTLVLIGIVSSLVIIFYTDLFSGIIPDSILLVLAFLGIGKIVLERENLLFHFAAGCISGALFLFIFLITKRRGIGFGDVKYAWVMGVLLGFPYSITGLYLAFLTGAIVALILIVAGKKKFGQTIPLGPFLVIGTVANVFFGHQLWQIFSRILGI